VGVGEDADQDQPERVSDAEQPSVDPLSEGGEERASLVRPRHAIRIVGGVQAKSRTASPRSFRMPVMKGTSSLV